MNIKIPLVIPFNDDNTVQESEHLKLLFLIFFKLVNEKGVFINAIFILHHNYNYNNAKFT